MSKIILKYITKDKHTNTFCTEKKKNNTKTVLILYKIWTSIRFIGTFTKTKKQNNKQKQNQKTNRKKETNWNESTQINVYFVPLLHGYGTTK